MARKSTSRSTGSALPSMKMGLAVIFGVILIVGLAILFTVLSYIVPIGRFFMFLGMALVGIVYPRLAGLTRRD